MNLKKTNPLFILLTISLFIIGCGAQSIQNNQQNTASTDNLETMMQNQNTFAKRQREMDKRFKAQEKRAKREERKNAPDPVVDTSMEGDDQNGDDQDGDNQNDGEQSSGVAVAD